YKEQDVNSEIVGKIYTSDFIYCIPDITQKMWLVQQGGIQFPVACKSQQKEQVPVFQGKGYVNREQILLLDTLDYLARHKFVTNILNEYQTINKKFHEATKNA